MCLPKIADNCYLSPLFLNMLCMIIFLIVVSPSSEQYVADIRTVQKLLQETEQTIDIINEEEDFYNMENTSYPEIDELREIIDPYQKLFNLVLNWRRTESRSDFTLTCALFQPVFLLTTNTLTSL